MAAGLLALIGLAFLIILDGMGKGLSPLAGSGDQGAEERAMPVSVLVVEMKAHYEIARGFTGRVVSRRAVDLAFDNGGIINQITVDNGARIEKGQALAFLDTDRLMARKSELAASLAEAEANLLLSRKTVERIRALFKQGHVTEQRLDDAIADTDMALARKTSAAAALNSIEVDLQKAVLFAPFDGIISRRLRDEGSIIAAGTPVLNLIEGGSLEAEVGMPLDFSHRLQPGDHVPLKTQDGHLVFSRVKSVVPLVRGSTRTALVTLDISGDVANLIADGSLVTAEIEEPVETPGFWVPLRALTADVRGLWRVYKVIETDAGDERIVFENVQILHSTDDRAFVSGTVSDGDRLIDGGVARIAPGKRVEVVKTSHFDGGKADPSKAQSPQTKQKG
ncbi:MULTISPECIES: efflux RND transporter periplasmic adaptor subunit [unclassified Iodidimonas]|jgi:RND family efflux transporter MFP subunit|uniref:efflux RND transporter periplasmic adaptor subunit n=1 Tax=unclassified Iodidimonas TaxID=2626145 RepID=UPI002482575B|nr:MULTISPECIES: efflux RND transporter periplasmic adaptor subunit [unclassified Iodidimonas]